MKQIDMKRVHVTIVLMASPYCFRRVSGHSTKGDLEWRGDSYLATECSASNGCDTIYKAFNMLIQKVSFVTIYDADDLLSFSFKAHSHRRDAITRCINASN